MSEEQQSGITPKTERSKDADTGVRTGDTDGGSGAGKFTRSIERANPVVLLLFMILLMIFILAAITLREGGSKGDGATPYDAGLAALKADVEARRSELNRQRMEMGLPPLEGGSEPIEEIATRLKDDMDTLVGLAGRFQQMLSDKDAEISRVNRDALQLAGRLQNISQENSNLHAEMNRSHLNASELDQLRKSAAETQAQRDQLAQELADVRTQVAEAADSVNARDFEDLQRRYDEALRSKAFFENRVTELEAQNSKQEIFAKSEDELLPAAVGLFQRLRKLEGMKASDLNTEYAKIADEIGATVLHTLDFNAGSSELSPEDIRQLTEIANAQATDEELTLIIGYASGTGDAAGNERISSERATAAAEFVASQKRDGQLVQAVYLGQTDRFSGTIPEQNQICEVWRIGRK